MEDRMNKSKTIFSLFLMIIGMGLTYGTTSHQIDFESIPGAYEGMEINHQFEQSHGVVFSLENGDSPCLAKIGPPMVAFGGPGENGPHKGEDLPAPDQGIGQFFLADDKVLGVNSPLILTFVNPVTYASGVIIDIDNYEKWTITARDENGAPLETVILESYDGDTGDGTATPWSISLPQGVIKSIRIKGERPNPVNFGLAFDNFQFCHPPQAKDDVLGNWVGTGIWSKDTETQGWMRLSSEDAIQVRSGDLDGDGFDDIICWYENMGVWAKYSSTYEWVKFNNGVDLNWIGCGDLNGDGKDDLLGSWAIGVWWRDSESGDWFRLHADPALMVSAGDVDGDGIDDLVGVWDFESAIWAKTSGDGIWKRYTISEFTTDIDCGDFNGDGYADIVGVFSIGVWWVDTQTRDWTRLHKDPTLTMACGDVDGDGRSDFLGVWPEPLSGVWIKYIHDEVWHQLIPNSASTIATGVLSDYANVIIQQGSQPVISGNSRFDFSFQRITTISSPLIFTIKNSGYGPLEIQSIEFSGGDSEQFNLIPPTATGPLSPTFSRYFQVSYQPLSRGAHTAVITIQTNDPNQNSFTFEVKGYGEGEYGFDRKWGSEGSGNGQFNTIYDIAIDSQKRVFVVDSPNNRVQVFDQQGGYITKFGNAGSGDGQFNHPVSIAIDKNDNIYVAEFKGNRIQKFDSQLGFLCMWGSAGNGDGEFDHPVDVSVDQNLRIYVSDLYNHRIQIFNQQGGFINKFGQQGLGDGEFNYPHGTEVDSAGYIYVVGENTNRIQVFNPDLTFNRSWGEEGSGDGQFMHPSGISIGPDGFIFITDRWNSRIQKYTPQGIFVNQFGNQGNGDGQLEYPMELQVSPEGEVYVVDTGNFRIQVFRPQL